MEWALLGVCPSIGADRVMGAVGSEPRRRARSRCHSTSSVRNKGDGLLVVPALSSFQAGQQKTAHNPKGTGTTGRFRWLGLLDPASLHNKISLARPARSSQFAQQNLFVESRSRWGPSPSVSLRELDSQDFCYPAGKSSRDRDNKTPVRDRTPILGHTPRLASIAMSFYHAESHKENCDKTMDPEPR